MKLDEPPRTDGNPVIYAITATLLLGSVVVFVGGIAFELLAQFTESLAFARGFGVLAVGVGNVMLFMSFIGIAWHRSIARRQLQEWRRWDTFYRLAEREYYKRKENQHD